MILPKQQNSLIVFVPARPAITKSHQKCLKNDCSCCKEIDHSMVLDGMEGFMKQGK